MITIDGIHSGGQTLRSSLSLSILTQKPFKFINIRGKRDKPGLQNQHLTAVNAAAKICGAQVKGNSQHSKELEFKPSKIIPGNYNFDIGTAGSTTLVLQALLPPLLFAKQKSNLKISGGTSNPLAPQAFYIKAVFLQILKLLNGFASVLGDNLEMHKQYVASLDPGCFISGIAKYEKTIIGYTTLGKLGVKAEDIGKECANNLLTEINSKCTVDFFTADQLLIYMALAKNGKIISSKITDHIKSNIEIIEKFLDIKFKIEGNEISIK